jgi:hypothetical protein
VIIGTAKKSEASEIKQRTHCPAVSIWVQSKVPCLVEWQERQNRGHPLRRCNPRKDPIVARIFVSPPIHSGTRKIQIRRNSGRGLTNRRREFAVDDWTLGRSVDISCLLGGVTTGGLLEVTNNELEVGIGKLVV